MEPVLTTVRQPVITVLVTVLEATIQQLKETVSRGESLVTRTTRHQMQVVMSLEAAVTQPPLLLHLQDSFPLLLQEPFPLLVHLLLQEPFPLLLLPHLLFQNIMALA